MPVTTKEKPDPALSPKVINNTMVIPAISAAAGATWEGPYIMAKEET